MTRIMEEKKTTIIEKTKVALQIIEGEGRGDVIELKAGEHTFGRGKTAEYRIRDAEETVSRNHFKITIKEGIVRIKDLKSANGTLVNDVTIDEEVEIKPGDVISAGMVQLKVMP
jgi:pSer/pThr/pTyr-binding forkhead associated (FHA) protein